MATLSQNVAGATLCFKSVDHPDECTVLFYWLQHMCFAAVYLAHKRDSNVLQVVMLGSGVPEFEQRMRQEEQERPDHFRGWVGFSVPVSHRIMAGCDILLMPSRFEPCGLNQLFGMRYGTIPIAHATGGLRDTIEDYNPFANGWHPPI